MALGLLSLFALFASLPGSRMSCLSRDLLQALDFDLLSESKPPEHVCVDFLMNQSNGAVNRNGICVPEAQLQNAFDSVGQKVTESSKTIDFLTRLLELLLSNLLLLREEYLVMSHLMVTSPYLTLNKIMLFVQTRPGLRGTVGLLLLVIPLAEWRLGPRRTAILFVLGDWASTIAVLIGLRLAAALGHSDAMRLALTRDQRSLDLQVFDLVSYAHLGR